MKAEYINPFLASINSVLMEMIPNVTIERGTLAKCGSPVETLGCASLIGVTGEAEGRVILDMAQATALKIAGEVNEETFTEFTFMVSSTINEITNMICGGAITILNNNNHNMDISTPTVFTGTKLELFDSSAVGEALVIPIHTNLGDLVVNVALRTN